LILGECGSPAHRAALRRRVRQRRAGRRSLSAQQTRRPGHPAQTAGIAAQHVTISTRWGSPTDRSSIGIGIERQSYSTASVSSGWFGAVLPLEHAPGDSREAALSTTLMSGHQALKWMQNGDALSERVRQVSGRRNDAPGRGIRSADRTVHAEQRSGCTASICGAVLAREMQS